MDAIVFLRLFKVLAHYGRQQVGGNTFFQGEDIFLSEITETNKFLPNNLAAVGILKIADDFQQGRFTGTIWSDNADFLAAVDHKVDIFKEILGAEGFTEGFTGY